MTLHGNEANTFPNNSRPPQIVHSQSIGSYITVIPKLHINAHNPPCPTDYSLNYVDGAGHRDSEAI